MLSVGGGGPPVTEGKPPSLAPESGPKPWLVDGGCEKSLKEGFISCQDGLVRCYR